MKIYGVALVLCICWDGADAFVTPSRTPFIRERTLRKISLLDDYMSDINDDDSKKNSPKPIGAKKEIKAPENSPFSPFSNNIPAAPVNTDPQARLDRLSRLGGGSTSTPAPVQNAEAVDTSSAVFPPATVTSGPDAAGGTPAFPINTPPVNTQPQTPATSTPPVMNNQPPPVRNEQVDKPKERKEPSFIAQRPPRPERETERSQPSFIAERPPRQPPPEMQRAPPRDQVDKPKERNEPSFIAERPRPPRPERKEPSFIAERPPRRERENERSQPSFRQPPPERQMTPPPVRDRDFPPERQMAPPPVRDISPPPVRNTERATSRPPSRGNSAPVTVRNDPVRERRSAPVVTGRAADARDIWDLSPVLVQGGSLETWSFPSPDVETVQVRLETQGRPLSSHVELWQGPNNSPQQMKIYLQDGSERPFNAVIATPRGSNAIAVRNVANLEFPVAACVDVDYGPPLGDRISQRKARLVQGGAVHSVPFDSYVSSVQILLTTDGRPLNATIELLQGPNTNKQVIQVYTEDGYDRPFFGMMETPGTGNVVRIVNDSPMEYPMYASVEPFRIGVSRNGNKDEYSESQSGVDQGQAAW